MRNCINVRLTGKRAENVSGNSRGKIYLGAVIAIQFVLVLLNFALTLVEKTLDKSDAKLKPITIWSPAFPAFQVSRVLIWALVGALLYFPEFWLAVVSALIWFEKLNRKPLYSSSSKTLNHKPEISWVEKLSKRERDFNTYPPSKTKFIYPKSSAGFLTRLNLRQVCLCQWRIAARARLLPILS